MNAFGHIFEVLGKGYFYDVGQNEIVAIDPVVVQALAAECRTGNSDCPVECEPDTNSRSHRLVLESINKARTDEGLFGIQRPVIVGPDSNPTNMDLEHLVLTLTDHCNLRCRYCLHGADLDWIRGHGRNSMPASTAFGALDYFLSRCTPDKQPAISFYGGESLLELEMIEQVIAEARKHPKGKDAVFEIDTNGIALGPRAIDVIVREKVFLQISLDGPRDTHDRYRVDHQGAGSFDRVIRGVDRLLDEDHAAHARLSFAVTLVPPVDLDSLAKFFDPFYPYHSRGITVPPKLRINTVNLRGQDHGVDESDWIALQDQLDMARNKYLCAVEDQTRMDLSPFVRALFDPVLIRWRHRDRRTLTPTYVPGGNCPPGRRKLHVSVDGRFHPCERTGDMMEIGNVQTGIRSQAVHVIQDRFHHAIRDRCGDCWALRMCGVCFGSQAERADRKTGAFPIPESICESVRRNKDLELKMIARVLEMPVECRAFLEDTVVC